MIRVEHSIQIGRAREEVFAFLTDVSNLTKWQSNIIRSRAVSQGEVRVGFQFEETMKLPLSKAQAICTVTEIKSPERFTFELRSTGPLDCDAAFELQPIAAGTRLTLVGTARLKGLMRLLQPIIAGELRRETAKELVVLKRLVEAEADPMPSLSTVQNRA